MVPDYDSIAAGVYVKDNKFFVAQRNENQDLGLKWEFPGGKLKNEEKYDVALIREFKEEFNIKITIIQELGSVEVKNNGKTHIIVFFQIDGDFSNINLKVHKESKFLSLDELKKLDLCNGDKLFIKNFDSNLKSVGN